MHEILIGSFGSFLASLGFGVLFNIKQKRKLFLAGLNGAMGGFVYECCRAMLLTDLEANFWAAVSFTVIAEVLARKMKTPVTSFIVCALIPLVPGGTMYDMMIEIITNDPYEALVLFLETLTIAGVLALGILLVETITALGTAGWRKWKSCRTISASRQGRDRR